MSTACCDTQKSILTKYTDQWHIKTYVKLDGIWNETDRRPTTLKKVDPFDESLETKPSDKNTSNIVEMIELVAKNEIIGIDICITDESCCHSFILSNDQITDSYIGEHDVETRSFNYDDLESLLENPTQEVWNKLFNCETYDVIDGDIYLEIYVPENCKQTI